jgi:endoglycosylceramidase
MYDGVGTIGSMVQSHWEAVAERLHGLPGVLGYEMLNEPWQGDWISNPALLVRSGAAETEAVGPYMEMTHATIRSVDSDTLTFYAPAELNNRLMRQVGYDYPFLPGEPMAFHVYCLTGTDGDGPVTTQQVQFCHFNDGFTLTQRESDLRRLQTAGFVTEFGAVSDSSTGLAEVRFVADAMDAVSPPLSWAFWATIPSEDDYRKELARPYPRAVAGDIASLNFNATTAAFRLTYSPHVGVQGDAATTEIYLGAYHYPSGYTLDVSPAECCSIAVDAAGLLQVATLSSFSGPLVEISALPRTA